MQNFCDLVACVHKKMFLKKQQQRSYNNNNDYYQGGQTQQYNNYNKQQYGNYGNKQNYYDKNQSYQQKDDYYSNQSANYGEQSYGYNNKYGGGKQQYSKQQYNDYENSNYQEKKPYGKQQQYNDYDNSKSSYGKQPQSKYQQQDAAPVPAAKKDDKNDLSEFAWTRDGKNSIDLYDKELVAYYHRVKNLIRANKFTTDEGMLCIQYIYLCLEKLEFIENTLQETAQTLTEEGASQFLTVCNDILASRAIQDLLESGSERHMRFMMHKFLTRMYHVATGKFCSFVLQAILKAAPFIIQHEAEGEVLDKGDGLPTLRTMLKSFCAVRVYFHVTLIFRN